MKKFVFGNAEQLKAIANLSKDGSASGAIILNVASVWSVTCRQNGKSPWDGKIGVSFYTEDRERKACVYRVDQYGRENVIGWLKYNPALKWCEDNLETDQ